MDTERRLLVDVGTLWAACAACESLANNNLSVCVVNIWAPADWMIVLVEGCCFLQPLLAW